MASSQKKALSEYRRRLKRKGVVRLELKVREEDAPLVRDVARALADPRREFAARALLKERFGERPTGFKDLLSRAPLEGVDLDRERDFGRDVGL